MTKQLEKIYKKIVSLFSIIFKRKKDIKLGLYGPTNSGKTSLANRICIDWLGEELGKVSRIPHETREIQMKEKVEIKSDGKSLAFNIVDTPGIATKIDFEDFVKKGLKKKDAKSRAKEATKGVIESIKWLDKMDMVLVVLDSTLNPINQVNLTILGNLEARGTPVFVVANKSDLKRSSVTKVRNSFPDYEVIGISAKEGHNMDYLYKSILKGM